MSGGSNWKRCDLHVHTPLSLKQWYGGDTAEVWEKYISELEALPDDFKVLGINDYLFIEGYEKVIDFQKRGRLQNISLILPVVELRVSLFGNLAEDDPWKKLNLHIIFADDVPASTIQAQFISAIQKNVALTEDHAGHWGGVIPSREALCDFGAKIKEASNGRLTASDLEIGFNCLSYDLDPVLNTLQGASTYFGGKYLIAVGKAEWEALRWDGSIANKKHAINSADFVFTAAESPAAWANAQQKLQEQGVRDLLLDCSDAHHFSESSEKDRIGNCFTWIKADATFEGLKQIEFERTRLKIAEDRPVPPAKTIQKVSIELPDDVVIARTGNENDEDKQGDFCFKGTHEIDFSSYFTCLIGGRGSGKSTILNLIAAKASGTSDFFDKNILLSGGRKISPSDFVTIEGSTDLEFISQNEIERFAESTDFTDAIYDRLSNLSNRNEFIELESEAEEANEGIEIILGLIQNAKVARDEIIRLQKNLSENEIIVSSYSSAEYVKLTEDINRLRTTNTRVTKAKARLTTLKSRLEEILREFPVINDPENAYENAINQILENLTSAKDSNFDFTLDDAAIETANNEIIRLSTELQTYLVEHGASNETSGEFERASGAIPEIKSELEIQVMFQEGNAESLQHHLESTPAIETVRAKFEDLIQGALEPLNQRLLQTNTNPEVKDIRFSYEFDDEAAKSKLFDRFLIEFSYVSIREFGTRLDSVQDRLFCIEPNNVDDHTTYLLALDAGPTNNARDFVRSILEDEKNFEIYKALIRRYMNDVPSFMRIVGFYGENALRDCSFGQRCTAVIVALIMFGNRPLLIDEPEAHLDSRLIAEYLVDLIKVRKNERQFIFATHNANFVVNADAELIQVLTVDEHNVTQVTSTTIESLENRDKLLALEGGAEAFAKRDRRLSEKWRNQ